MAKKQLRLIAKELGEPVERLAELAEQKLPREMIGGAKGVHMWVDEESIPILREAAEVPEFTPKHFYGRVKRKAPNPAYVYVQMPDGGKVVPVVVPRNMSDRLVGKRVLVEEIEDARGVSYRWVRE